MRVLVTRPQPAATATAQKIEALGHRPIVFPLMEAIHSPQAALDALTEPHTVIAITSAETLRAIAAGKPDLSPFRQTPFFCVGDATARAARQLGFQSVHAGAGTADSLAGQIANADATSPGAVSVLYLAGQPRTPGFEMAMRHAGIPCRTAEVYRMSPLAYTAEEVAALLLSGWPDIILFYSSETARHFFRLPLAEKEAEFQGVQFACLSEAVAQAVPAGRGTILVARNPSEDSLLSLL